MLFGSIVLQWTLWVAYLESHASPSNIQEAQSSLRIDWQRKNYHRHGDRFFQDENLTIDLADGATAVMQQLILLLTNQKPLFTV